MFTCVITAAIIPLRWGGRIDRPEYSIPGDRGEEREGSMIQVHI